MIGGVIFGIVKTESAVEVLLKSHLFRRSGKTSSDGWVWKLREMSKYDLKSDFIDFPIFNPTF